ncbi:uncharacterized protein [Physcomitrium patens]|uniref:Uncharacterized protein n=1 Tax=Physcomitrium patens TaxID=3218 RepID=A0A2K1IJ30_PHYPA|nr:uncharacterized protein LOC112276022 [Physcomitrium patens]PNR29291.1 hypothetical protein PHYPA_027983 [Physcomitrium patens]|eukprot:XP_024362725.1 uncharacterized protein LOC112276022 [Physcomitrella patens]
MRRVLVSWLCVTAVVAAVCCVAVTAEEERSVGDHVALHRYSPRSVRMLSEQNGITSGARMPHEERVDDKSLQSNFNPFNRFQTFGVRRESHGHKKCGMASKLGSWWSKVFRYGRDHHNDHYRHHHLHHEHDHENQFESDTEHHHHKLHSSFGWDLLGKTGRWFSSISSSSSDEPNLITWREPADRRKAPIIESVTEPLDVHALQKISKPSLLCSLREKLSYVFAAVSEEIVTTTNGPDNSNVQSDVIKRNLKKFMGDSMQLRIIRSVCDTSSMSSCEQEFCDVFLSHPRSGILMAFRVLGLDPVRAAINPEGVASHLVPSRFQSRLLMTKSELLMITNLEKACSLARVIYQAVLKAEPNEETTPVSSLKLRNIFSKAFGGELNPCKACLRQEIFRLKKLTKEAMIEVCESPADSNLGEACNFAEENKFIFKTLFAYKFRLWEKAAAVCRDRKECDPLATPSVDNSEQATNDERVPKLHLTRVNASIFRNPRGVEVNPTKASFIHWRRHNCRQRTLHRVTMLRGHSLDATASQLLSSGDDLSLQPGNGALIVVDFVKRPQFELNQGLNVVPLPEDPSTPKKWNFFHGTMSMEGFEMQTFEPRLEGMAELESLREFLKRPLPDTRPAYVDTAVEDTIDKPHIIPDVLPTATLDTDSILELPASNDANTEHQGV